MNQAQAIYAPTARFDSGRGMTDEELRIHAPSVFATSAHASRSERFAPIPTIDVVNGLRQHGFEVVGARQCVTRAEGRAPYAKHLLRIRKIDAMQNYRVGDTVAEILLQNANDGSSVYDLYAGLFRILCLNSMVAGAGTIDAIKVRHTGRNILDNVIEGTFRVVEQAQVALAAPDQWSRIQLARDEQVALAESARIVRFGDSEGNVASRVTADQLLRPRRNGDEGNDLWRCFNRVQENSVKGGLRSITYDVNSRRRRNVTRPITSIDGDVKLNRALWTLAAKLAESKGVPATA